MKKLMILILLVCFSFTVLAGCGAANEAPKKEAVPAETKATEAKPAETKAEEPKKEEAKPAAKEAILGYTPLSMAIAYFNDVNKGIQKASNEMGVKILLNDPQMDAAKQASGVENMIAGGANVVAICSIDIATAQSAVKYAHEKKIPVISHISAFKDADVYVRLDEYKYGYAAGEAGAKYITANMGGKAKVAIMDADSLGGDLLLRSKGMIDGVKSAGPGVEIVARTTAFEEAKAMAAMENFLQEHPDINFAVTSNEPGAYGVLAASEAAGKKVKISSIGSEDRLCDLIMKDKIVSGIDPSPMWTGAKMVEIAKKIVNGESYDKEYWVPFRQVTKDNAQQMKDERAVK